MLETRQLHPTLAREVVGLSLWQTLDDATVAELRDLYAQYGVLVFRRQALSEAEFAAFCTLFGPLERALIVVLLLSLALWATIWAAMALALAAWR